jgi:hypothetical protein
VFNHPRWIQQNNGLGGRTCWDVGSPKGIISCVEKKNEIAEQQLCESVAALPVA